MRLHAIEKRVVATVAAAVVLVVLLVVAGWMWALMQSGDELSAAVVAVAFASAGVILVASWPVLHVAVAVARDGGTRPRRPRVWIAVFVVAVVVWGGVLIWPAIFLALGLFWVAVALLALLAARRLVLRGVRRARG